MSRGVVPCEPATPSDWVLRVASENEESDLELFREESKVGLISPVSVARGGVYVGDLALQRGEVCVTIGDVKQFVPWLYPQANVRACEAKVQDLIICIRCVPEPVATFRTKQRAERRHRHKFYRVPGIMPPICAPSACLHT